MKLFRAYATNDYSYFVEQYSASIHSLVHSGLPLVVIVKHLLPSFSRSSRLQLEAPVYRTAYRSKCCFLTPNTLVVVDHAPPTPRPYAHLHNIVVDQSLPRSEAVRLWSLSNMASNIWRCLLTDKNASKLLMPTGWT